MTSVVKYHLADMRMRMHVIRLDKSHNRNNEAKRNSDASLSDAYISESSRSCSLHADQVMISTYVAT